MPSFVLCHSSGGTSRTGSEGLLVGASFFSLQFSVVLLLAELVVLLSEGLLVGSLLCSLQ